MADEFSTGGSVSWRRLHAHSLTAPATSTSHLRAAIRPQNDAGIFHPDPNHKLDHDHENICIITDLFFCKIYLIQIENHVKQAAVRASQPVLIRGKLQTSVISRGT